MKEHGVALDSDWSYDITKFTVTPPSEIQLKADKYKLISITHIKTLSEIKDYLDTGMPVVFETKMPTSFLNIPENGTLLDPRSTDKIEGWHTLLAVGYTELKKALIIRNSWGTSWGLKGYAYLPYTYFSKGYVVDAWTGKIKKDY